MTKLFADRAFVTVNGFELVHLKTADLEIDEALTVVDTMSRNHRSAGYKQGNKKISLTLELEVEALAAQFDLALANPTADIGVVWELGGERYIATGVRQASTSMKGAVGGGSKSIKLMALDVVNENGTSVNADISLG
jgi:hypothetical protein